MRLSPKPASRPFSRMTSDPLILAWIAAIFLFAGTVKGVIGMGLPTIALGLMVTSIGLEPALAIVVGPSFFTNIWQAFGPGHVRLVLTRIWPFILAMLIAIPFGTLMLTRLDVALVTLVLGAILSLYGIYGLARPLLRLPPRAEKPVGLVAGALNGFFCGMTSSTLVPGIPYLQALGLPREALMQAMGLMFFTSSIVLGASLGSENILTLDLAIVSVAAVLPAFLGMSIGQRLRRRLRDETFRRIFFISLVLLGIYLVTRSILSLI